MRKALTGTALLISLLGTSAAAQSSGIPKEFPPADYTGNQYVDSEGCAFIRAGISGNTQWVPRVNQARRQLCNFQPTFPELVGAPEEEIPDPLVTNEDAAASEVAEASVEAETAPLIILPSAAEREASNRPVTVPIPGRTVSSPVPAVAPAEEESAPPQMLTRAEVCEGKFGPQPGFISSTTMQTLDCGPAPASADVTAADPAPEPLRMTLAEICEAAKVGDRLFVDAFTGDPIICPPTETIASVAPATRPDRMDDLTQSMTGDDAARAGTSVAATARTGAIPASNPSVTTAPRVPAGYENVWSDGRLNPQRGLPDGSPQASLSTQVMTPMSAPTYQYVQVGSFAVPSNAERLLARLQGMGMPTGQGQGGGLKIVAVGPYADAGQLQSALGVVRGMGFTDAFLRN